MTERMDIRGKGDWRCPDCGGAEYSRGWMPEPKTCLKCEALKDFADGTLDPAKLRTEALELLHAAEEILVDTEEQELFEIQVRNTSMLYAFHETHNTEEIAQELHALRCDLMRVANGLEALRKKLGGEEKPFSSCFHIDADDPSFIRQCE